MASNEFLRTIYELTLNGFDIRKIKEKFPEMPTKNVRTALAFLIASDPKLYADATGLKPGSDRQILIDENLPPDIIPGLFSRYGRLTHTRFEELNGKPDSQVWRWAANNMVDAIVTRDKRMKSPEEDLTYIAVVEVLKIVKAARANNSDIDLSKLPLVIHLESFNQPRGRITMLFNKHAQEILQHMERRETPYILVRESRIDKGRSYDELLTRYAEDILPDELAKHRHRVEAMTSRIVEGKKEKHGTVSEEEIQKIRVMVVEKDRKGIIVLNPSPASPSSRPS